MVETSAENVWSYFFPVKVVFGCGSLKRLGEFVEGKKVFLVVGNHIANNEKLLKEIVGLLGEREVAVFSGVEENPSYQTIDEGVKRLKQAGCGEVVGIGGGSVLDAAKLIALVAANGGSARQYAFEGKKVEKHALPIVAVPTTAGTASEVDSFAVVSDKHGGLKTPVRAAPFMYPKVALLDPELTVSCPKTVTANSGADALVHAIECFYSTRSTPITETLALHALELVWSNLKKAFDDGKDIEARSGMLLGSMLAGMAFSNTGTGMAHAISYPLTAKFGITHGNACSLTTPEIFVFNAQAERQKARQMAKITGAKTTTQAKQHLTRLFESVGLKTRLSEFGIRKEDLPVIVEGALQAPARASPREMSAKELKKILEEIL